MSVLNPEFYAVDESLSQFNSTLTYSYPFNDEAYPEYRQNYVLNNTINNSIWLFTFANSPYSPYYEVTTHARENTNPFPPVTLHSRNKLNKNMFRFADSIYPGITTTQNYNTIRQCRWSPNAIKPASDARFILNYDYGNTCLYPTFNMLNPENGQTINNIDYTTAITNYSTWLVTGIFIRAAFGERGKSTDRVLKDVCPFATFAGEMLGMVSNDTITRENYSGVWYISGDNYLFNIAGVWWTEQKSGEDVTFNNISSTQMIPYGQELLREATRENGNYVYHYLGMSIYDAGHCVTALGHYWARSLTSALSSELGTHCTDENIVCALIDDNNRIIFSDPEKDTYIGQEIAEIALLDPENNFNWGAGAEDYEGEEIEEIQEDTEPENSEETEETELNESTYSTSGAFNSVYALSETSVNAVAQWLWNGSPDLEWETVLTGLTLMGENPINAVVSLKLFPLNLPAVSNSGAYESIYVGKESTGVMARLVGNTTIIVDMGSMSYDVGDNLAFLNYEPYSSCNLYIPYCGILSLSPTEVIGKTINVKMIIDLVTGACTGVVFIDNIAYAYKDGILSVDIPVTGANMSQYFSNLLNGAMSGATSGMSMGSNINDIVSTPISAPATIGVGGAIGAVAGAIAGQAKGVTISKSGASSPACSLAQPQYCYLIIETPKEIEWLENYGHTNGFLSYRTGTIISLQGTGFSIFENVDCSGISGATENEKEEIKRILESGVYL